MSSTSSFAPVTTVPVPALGLQVQHFRHPCGAEHLHLACDDAHCAFAVAFRTVPEDSTGLPHILEHLSLCGSERYPVRDPFFMMLRRSLQTFMNAFTYPDMTCYPFATQVAKDYDNLLGIYLDAVFAPTLNRLDFAQEGWRLEPAEFPLPTASDPATLTDWAIKGVVFNEMKGSMGDKDNLLFQALKQTLLPDTCYRHNSGGEPLVIPDLVYEDLVAFHRSRYCGANTCFTTYGALDVAAIQQRFIPYLERHPGTALAPAELQTAAPEDQVVDVPVPLEEGQDPQDLATAALCWTWPDISDFQEVLLGDLTERLLFGHPAAPLRLALETSHLGRSCGGSGYMAYLRNGVFAVELEGMDPERYEELPPLVEGCLRRLAEEGFSEADIAAAVHQLELARRRIGGDGTPFGLTLCLRAVMAWNHGRDPAEAIDQNPAIVALKQTIAEPGFWPRLLRERLLDHPARVFLRTRPDAGYHQARGEREAAIIAERVAELQDQDKHDLVDQAEALAERQATEDDASVLPELLLSDVPTHMQWASAHAAEAGLSTYLQATNRLLHIVAALPLPELDDAEWDLLPVVTGTLGHLGVGTRSYQEQASLLNATCGSLSSWYQISNHADSMEQQRGFLFIEVHGLADQATEFIAHPAEALWGQRYDELPRMKELLLEGLNGLQGRLLHAGHDMAMSAAAYALGGRASLGHRLSGIGRLQWLREQAETDAVASIADGAAALLQKLRQQPVELAVIGDTAEDTKLQTGVRACWDGNEVRSLSDHAHTIRLPDAATVGPRAYTMATPVNFCALALPAVPLLHEDAAALSVACQLLKDQFLHRRIREQGGAYGAMADCNTASGLISLGSYRDPRLTETYADMTAGLDWLRRVDDDEQALRSAILGRIARLDAPGSPASEGRRRFVADLVHTGPDEVGTYRQRLLQTGIADIRRVAERWLVPDRIHQAVLTSKDAIDATGLDWERVPLG